MFFHACLHVHLSWSTCFMLYAMLSMLRSIFPMCSLARSACFYACLHVYLSFLHALCFRPWFPMLCLFFCSYMLTCLCDVVGFALLGFMCLCVYFHAIWLDPCFHMLICLDSCSSMLMYQACTCWCVYFYAYLSRSMFSHAYVSRSIFFTCFILSSMCLCTPCHVCVPRPRLCLSCHVLL